jgi:hypothetical protein
MSYDRLRLTTTYGHIYRNQHNNTSNSPLLLTLLHRYTPVHAQFWLGNPRAGCSTDAYSTRRLQHIDHVFVAHALPV